MKITTLILLCLSCGCAVYTKKPHDDLPGYVFPTAIERYEQKGYRYVPAVILSPAHYEYVGTNR